MIEYPRTQNAGGGDSPQNSPQGVSNAGAWLGRESNPRHADFQFLPEYDERRRLSPFAYEAHHGGRPAGPALDAPRRAPAPQNSPRPVTPLPTPAPLVFRKFRDEQQRVARRLASVGGATR